MVSVLMVLGGAWLTWIAGLLLTMLTGPLWARQPCTTGFWIILPSDSMHGLTQDERNAVYMHERGHQAHWHPWINLARAALFRGRSKWMAQGQEIQADDWAAARCDPLVLASALSRLSRRPFDRYRVQRLLAMDAHAATPRR